MPKQLHEMTFEEAVATDDVFVLDRMSHGVDIDTDLSRLFLDQISENFSPLEQARFVVRLTDRIAYKDERLGRLLVETIKVKVSRAIDWSRPTMSRVAKHGKPTWAIRRRGKHAA